MAVASGTALAMMAVASAVSAYGAVQQGKAANQQAKVQSAIYQQQAERERLVAASEEQDFRRQQSRQMATRRAMMGVSGVDAATGSPLMVSEDFAGEVELQALRIRNGGEVAATRMEQQAQLTRMAGKAAQTGGYFRAGSSLLHGFGQAGYYASDKKGIG